MLMNPGPRPQEISFQEFKTQLLARGQVRSNCSRGHVRADLLVLLLLARPVTQLLISI
jgi:hypothetical protein